MKIKILLLPISIAVAIIVLIWFAYPMLTNGVDGVLEQRTALKAQQEKFSNLDNKIKKMSNEDWLKYKDKYRPEIGDVFFTNIGTIGKTAIVTQSLDYCPGMD